VIEEYVKSKKISKINAVIYVERESQRHIILGKKGDLIKKISTKAREDLELLLGQKVYIRIWVKVSESWSNDREKLKLLGLKNN
ncbi:KH domain-containing protein, partial [Pseudomonadota bacterium]|nr:KH domain-containing protein [Pseudomonadota bacterium]